MNTTEKHRSEWSDDARIESVYLSSRSSSAVVSYDLFVSIGVPQVAVFI